MIVSSSLSQLLTTSKTAKVLHPPEIADKSLFWNILLITPTRSRFCRPFPKRNDCFQEFDSIPGGEGGIPPVAPRAVHEGINGFDNQSTNMCPVPQRMARRLEGWRWAKGEPRSSDCVFSPVARVGECASSERLHVAQWPTPPQNPPSRVRRAADIIKHLQ